MRLRQPKLVLLRRKRRDEPGKGNTTNKPKEQMLGAKKGVKF